MTPVSGTTVLNRDIDQPITALHQNDVTLSHSVIPTTISRESRGSWHRTIHNRPVTVGSSNNEVYNRLSHYRGDNNVLRRDIVEGLIDLLDTHNALVQLFRTACEKFEDTHIPNFKVRLYNVVATREYELPTGDMLGAIVYETGPESDMDYDIVLEEHSGHSKRVNKLHPSYMSLQFLLLFIYGEDGYFKDLKMIGSTNSSSENRRLTMLAYYSYYLHDRANRYNYLSRTEKLFQQYVVTAFCAIELKRIDYIREHQNDIRNEYLSGIYDAINQGDNDGFDCGSKLILPQSFIGGPRYIEPAVQILVVHLQNMQRVVFKETYQLDSLVLNSHKKKTTLTELMYYNEQNVNERHLTYLNFPSEYVWYSNGKYWRRRRIKTKSSIRRLAYVHPTVGDLFYQRMLLCHQTGCTSFPGIRLHIDDSDLEDYTLYEFETCLNHCSKSVTDFGLHSTPPHLMSIIRNRLLMEEKSYDRQLLATERDKLLLKLNENQRQFFNLILNACFNNEQQLVFVYGHGGTGKTFLWKSILYTLRCERKIFLVIASYGIASLLLPASRTAHSRLEIPLDLTDTSVCAIKKNTQLADLLKEICLIVWDESPMNDRRCFETLDRTLRDILNQQDHLFGGKMVMLGGDFRQTLPVKRGASRNETIRSSISN
uniref:ATP-dependent DNA helicase n=1 Tax=Tanacetum cinerariifolium TaxID=118510 RepID=A0A699HD68_TANCI|nr:DNA helicase [Tanacetum cinerariifolium]